MAKLTSMHVDKYRWIYKSVLTWLVHNHHHANVEIQQRMRF